MDIRICKLLKLISNGVCSINIVGGLYHKIHEFNLKILYLSLDIYINSYKRRPTKKSVLILHDNIAALYRGLGIEMDYVHFSWF